MYFTYPMQLGVLVGVLILGVIMNNLTDRKIKSLKPKAKAYKIYDNQGNGLYINVSITGTKSFRLKYRIKGKEKTDTLGLYPTMLLSHARELAVVKRRKHKEGIDTSKEKIIAKFTALNGELKTIKDLCNYWLDTYKIEYPKKAKDSELRFEKYLYPHFKQRPLETIKLKDLEDFLFGIVEKHDIYDTVKRMKQNLVKAYSKALKHNLVQVNIAREIDNLPTKEIKHFPAITDVALVDDFAKVVAQIYDNKEDIILSTAIKLLPHLFARPSELRTMQWKDIDFGRAFWTYKMTKVGQERRVPLSAQVMKLLRELYKHTGDLEYCFPATTQAGYINKLHLSSAVKRCGIDTNIQSLHGFRASATTFLHEVLKMKDDWIELQLGHKLGNDTKIAYKRTLFLDERIDMMNKWSNYLDDLRTNIMDIRIVKARR